jgi:hypothetical protein
MMFRRLHVTPVLCCRKGTTMPESDTELLIDRLQRAVRWWRTVAILALSVVVLAIVAGMAWLALAYSAAVKERARTEKAMQLAEMARQEAVEQRQVAEQEKTRAEEEARRRLAAEAADEGAVQEE